MIKFVKLTDAQVVQRDRKMSSWIDTLISQANDDTDPETRDNARILLNNRGISY